mgnify:CR=1 FL=1
MTELGVPHRRDDGELLGWIRPRGEAWAAVDVLGRPVAQGEWLDLEAALDAVGLEWLADVWMLEDATEQPVRVRILEVTPTDAERPGRIVVKVDDFGDMQRPPTQQFVLPWPLPARLRPWRQGDPDGRTL